MTEPLHSVVVSFGDSRATDGTDIAAIIRQNLPDTDVRAELDAAGAVCGYRIELHYDDADSAAAAALDLAAFLSAGDYQYEVVDPDV